MESRRVVIYSDLEWWVKGLRSDASMAGLCTLFVAVVVVFMVIVLKRYK